MGWMCLRTAKRGSVALSRAMGLMLIPKLLLLAVLSVFSLYSMFLYFFKIRFNLIFYTFSIFSYYNKTKERVGQDKLYFHWYALSTMESMNRPGGVEAD